MFDEFRERLDFELSLLDGDTEPVRQLVEGLLQRLERAMNRTFTSTVSTILMAVAITVVRAVYSQIQERNKMRKLREQEMQRNQQEIEFARQRGLKRTKSLFHKP